MDLPPIRLTNFRFIEKIGEGGMGDVYLAEQKNPARRAAIKIIRADPGIPAEMLESLKREGDTAARFRHPHLVTVYECGIVEDRYYLAMEYLPAGSLEDRLAGPMDEAAALSIVKAIADALRHMHAKGYVHRDLKPANILFDDEDRPVLADFGIAKTPQTEGLMTQMGYSVGTPRYMSPEQVLNRPLDGRTDLYSLGIVFYQMLTGAVPFHRASEFELKQAHVNESARQLPRDLRHFQKIMDRLLAKDPGDRFADAGSLLEALESVPTGESNATLAAPVPVRGQTGWFAELRGRRIFRVAAFYGGGAWVLTELITTVVETYNLDPWMSRAALAAFIAGFPLAMVLAWIYDLRAGRIEKTPGTRRPGRFLAFTAAMALAALGGLFVAFYPNGEVIDPNTDSIVRERKESVAVLPFASLSSDPDDQYFADGLTEELLNQLARVPELHVPGRTSSFYFRGKDLPLPDIGRALGVNYLLEGSVRWGTGNTLRVSAQLIRSSDGYHVWSETFDKTLDDVFEIQDQIAQTTVRRIEKELGIEILGNLATGTTVARTIDAETHRMFLEARARLRERAGGAVPEAYRQFLAITERAPEFALGWAGLSDSALLQGAWGGPLSGLEGVAIAKSAMDRAMALAPDESEVHKSKGFYLWIRDELNHLPVPDEAIRQFEQAVVLDARNAEALTWLASAHSLRREFESALKINELAIAADSLHVVARFNRFEYLLELNRRTEGIGYAIEQLRKFPEYRAGYKQLADQLIEAGDPGRALLWLREGASKNESAMLRVLAVSYALRLGFPVSELQEWIDKLRAVHAHHADLIANIGDGNYREALSANASYRQQPDSWQLEPAALILALVLRDSEAIAQVLSLDYPALTPPFRLQAEEMFESPLSPLGPALWAAAGYRVQGNVEAALEIARSGQVRFSDPGARIRPAFSGLIRAGWECQLGNPGEALRWLLFAEERGWVGLGLSDIGPISFDQDPVFDCVQAIPDFQAFMGRMRAASAEIVESIRSGQLTL